MIKHDPYINKQYRLNFVKNYVDTFNSEEFTLKSPRKTSQEKLELVKSNRGVIENTFRERVISSIQKWKDIKVKVNSDSDHLYHLEILRVSYLRKVSTEAIHSEAV